MAEQETNGNVAEAAAAEAAQNYVDAQGKGKLWQYIAAAAKEHEVKATSITSYLAGVGARALSETIYNISEEGDAARQGLMKDRKG